MSSLRRALRRLRQLSARERKVLVLAAGLLPVVHALQRRLPFRTWRRFLERSGPAPARSHAGDPSVLEIAWSVEAARNWLPGGFKCLPSAYTAHLLLHHYGHASQIHVGVRRDPQGQVEAHAWVDCGGQTVVGFTQDLAQFVALPPLHAVGK